MASLGGRYSGGSCSVRRHAGVQSAAGRPCSVWIAARRREGVKAAAITRSRRSVEWGRGEKKLDEWMRVSAAEIVKNLRNKGRILAQVYPEESGGGAVELRMQREADWEAARAGWEKGEAPLPEGVIFVEELVQEEEEEDNGVNKVWGIVVQGRRGCCSSCYLLKTTRVESGLGSCCTYFCLIKVTSFNDTVKTQFNNSWLVHHHHP